MDIIDLDNCCVIKWRLTDICNYHCSYCVRRPLVKQDTLTNINEDFNKCLSATNDVIRIANELYQINNKDIKIDLIGGEISLFNDLYKILDALYESEHIKEINITTNLCRNIEYYTNLCDIAKKYDKKLSLTASFHCEYAKLDEFMDKVRVLNDSLRDNFKCETVITNVNSQVNDFIQRCEEIGCYYMCEEDLYDPTKRGQTVKNFKPKYRYKVIEDDGSESLYYTRNEVIKSRGIAGVNMRTSGCKCSRDTNYVYIEQDKAIPCHNNMPISEYHVNTEMRECMIGLCTLCGHISIYSNK